MASTKPATAPPPTAAAFLPQRNTLSALKAAAEACRGCHLYKPATQTVFGEGPSSARLLMVGEQPGDQEDRQGKPFVGPAGGVLSAALAEAEIERGDVYVTNVVKHFKFEQRGRRRLHKKPDSREIFACRPWLEAELAAVQPQVLICLGATAAQALIGRDFRITRQRGQLLETSWCAATLATWHPSAVLRVPSQERRQQMQAELVADLRVAQAALAG